MDEVKGQITIETMMIIGFFIILFVAITFPTAFRVSGDSKDVRGIMEAQNNLNKISTVVEAVAIGQRGTVMTITMTSNINNWEINTNAPMDGTNPTPERPVLNYEVSIWNSTDDVPRQLYRIRSGWGAVTMLNISGVSTGESAGLGMRACGHQGDGKGSWDVRIENMANSSNPYIVFNTSDYSANCTASNTAINMFLVG